MADCLEHVGCCLGAQCQHQQVGSLPCCACEPCEPLPSQARMCAAAPLGAQPLEGHMRKAMWLYRSSLNQKAVAFSVAPGSNEEHEDPQTKLSLKPLWTVMEPHVEAYSNRKIRQAYA